MLEDSFIELAMPLYQKKSILKYCPKMRQTPLDDLIKADFSAFTAIHLNYTRQ